MTDNTHAGEHELPLDWQTYSIAALYDSIGVKYESAFLDIPEQTASLQWLLSHLPNPQSRALDIGCGTGRPVAETLSLAPERHLVHGIDISEAMLSAARERVPTATFQQIDFRDFVTRPSTYDAITCYFALLAAMSQAQIKGMVGKIYEWLKPGGLFVLSTIPGDLEHHELQWLGRPVLVSSLTEEQYLLLLKEVGYTVEYAKVTNFMPKAVDAGLCRSDQVWTEPQLFVYARKH